MSESYRVRVGTVRPSHLMFTSGVGALVDLPNFAVLVRGLDDWDHSGVGDEYAPIVEPRLLAAARTMEEMNRLEELRPAPWRPAVDTDPHDPALRIGVPVLPFPSWLRCTACNLLASVESMVFRFENDRARRPQDARFYHDNCAKVRRAPLAVAARFMLCCANGHLDDFPYTLFVHRGAECDDSENPALQMDDHSGNVGANVTVQCKRCPRRRNIRDAQGRRGRENLPRCRGRHPHLGTFDAGCTADPLLLVVGASNQWFAQTLSTLDVPKSTEDELDSVVAKHWESVLSKAVNKDMMKFGLEIALVARDDLARWDHDQVWAAVERHRSELDGAAEAEQGYPDLRTPEWQILSAGEDLTTDALTLRRDPDGVPRALEGIFTDVVQVERLREVRALVGFTRLDAPDPDDPELVKRVSLTRDPPTWLPASEVHGEGIFLRVGDDLLADWERRVTDDDAMKRHRAAYAQFRRNRYSERLRGTQDWMKNWPGMRYLALHTLSHLMIRTIALECGYNSASLSERIYAGDDDDPRGGILIYTAVPDAEGTLGGLVALAEPEPLVRLTMRALIDARTCSSDPLCAERLPHQSDDFLHGAACHVCLFVSETTCERGNRFLDRRFVVPIGDQPKLALFDVP
ncbi:MAG: DUF1998 domain-containing protein [Streptosporangiales bacterium]|nr:DUF1998 domain-containing protein [Streptosporangiales bacterium]